MNKPAICEYVHRVGTLVAIEEIPPKPQPPQVDYIFEEIHAKCHLMRKGKRIDDLGSYNDFYGYETSIKTAIKDMTEYCTENEIDDRSEVEVIVVRVASQFRARERPRQSQFDTTSPEWVALEYGSRRGLPDYEEKTVWSSRSPANGSKSNG